MARSNIKVPFNHSATIVLAGLALVGCGPEFDPPSKLQSLRILAVKKDDPYLRPTAAPASDGDATARPDNTAHMTLAMQDARLPDLKRDHLQKIWFAGCSNPPGDNYFTCLLNVWLSFKALSELGPGPAGLGPGQSWSLADVVDASGQPDTARLTDFVRNTFPEAASGTTGATDPSGVGQGTSFDDLINEAYAIKVGSGDTFDYTVPDWLIDKHAPPAQSTLPRYGLSQVYLALCDGELGFSPGWEKDVDPLAVLTDATRGFPLTCYEPNTKNERGPDNFMVSYSNLYVYDEVTNHNPVISGLTFGSNPVDPSALCIGEQCLGFDEKEKDLCPADKPPDPDKLEPNAAVIPSAYYCQPNVPSGCPEYDVSPQMSQADNSELDEIASRVGGGNERLLEQMWLRFYADQGDIANDAKRLQDATEGWFSEHKTKWKPPTKGDSSPAHIWSVAYDNRGGVEWVRTSVCLYRRP